MTPTIAIATCNEFPNLADDELLGIEQLKKCGINPVPIIWNAPNVDWRNFACIIIRSTWDYVYHYQKFIKWLQDLQKLKAKVCNPVETIIWNLDKKYLIELEERDIPIVPTLWYDGGASDLNSILTQLKNEADYVVKPTISAGAKDTYVVSGSNRQQMAETIRQVAASSSVMIQPFYKEIISIGEWSLIFFKDQFSHAVLKKPKDGDFRVQEKFGGQTKGLPPAEKALDLARSTLQQLEKSYFFARVDIIPIGEKFFVSEVELIEPCLFFTYSYGKGPELFAKTVKELIF